MNNPYRLPLMPVGGGWQKRAACAGEWTLHFDIIDKPTARDIAEAKAVCATCPVKRECLQDYTDNPDPHAFAGGKTPYERENAKQTKARDVYNTARRTERHERREHIRKLVRAGRSQQQVAWELGVSIRLVQRALIERVAA